MNFPKRLRHRGKGRVLATIYKREGCYRLYWRQRVDGKPRSRFKDFASYSKAKKEGDTLVADLAKGNATALSPGQTADALNAFEELQRFYQATGRKLSLRFVVGEYCESAKKLGHRKLPEAVDGFLSSVANVQRVDLKVAVGKFLDSRKPLTEAKDGKRPQLSPGWHYIVTKWLEEFAAAFPGHAVNELTKDHLATYMASHNEVSARTRNGRRNAVKLFFKWAVEREYLQENHKLVAAEGMAKEVEDFGDIECYTAKELRLLLDGTASEEYKSLRPVILLNGLAGLRLQEVVRLTWSDVFRVKGHIEVTAGKAKTRQRRLVQVCPALAQWLQEFRDKEGLLWSGTLDAFHDLLGKLRESVGVEAKRNGLRHAWVSAHFALHANENLTAAQAGNSPDMIHGHYKGLMTKKEARAWFNVRPAKQAKGSNVIQFKTARS